jgi:hypothetical protein
MIAIGGQPLLSYTVIASLNPQPDGKVTASYQDGTVLSCQPNGTFERRPAGTNGAWECATQTAQGLVYEFDHVAYLVPLLIT